MYEDSKLNESLRNYIKYGDLGSKIELDEALEAFVYDASGGFRPFH